MPARAGDGSSPPSLPPPSRRTRARPPAPSGAPSPTRSGPRCRSSARSWTRPSMTSWPACPSPRKTGPGCIRRSPAGRLDGELNCRTEVVGAGREILPPKGFLILPTPERRSRLAPRRSPAPRPERRVCRPVRPLHDAGNHRANGRSSGHRSTAPRPDPPHSGHHPRRGIPIKQARAEHHNDDQSQRHHARGQHPSPPARGPHARSPASVSFGIFWHSNTRGPTVRPVAGSPRGRASPSTRTDG